MTDPNKLYSPGTLLELTDWALKYSEHVFPRGFYLILSSKVFNFQNGESLTQYDILSPDGNVENAKGDGWVALGLREVNPNDYE